MVKKIVMILVIFIMCSINVCAEEKPIHEQFLENNGSYLDETITNEAQEYFDENNITMEDPTAFSQISIKQVISYIFGQIKSKLSRPIKLLGLLIGVILLISIVENLNVDNSNSSLSKVFDIIGVLVCLGIIFDYVAECINTAASTLYDGSNFMLCYVPVFAGVIGASGSLTTASVYNIGVLIVAEIAVQIAVNFLLPMMGIFFAMSIIESINPALSLSGITEGIKKCIQWILGLVMTFFVGLITVQSIIGVSADTVGIRTAKFMVSNFIPVIGSAISDAYTTVKGSIGLLRSGVGTFGIVILMLTILPPIITIIAFKISLSIGGFISDLMGVKKVSSLLKNTSSVLSISISLLVCFSLMLIIATTVMMLVSMNIG